MNNELIPNLSCTGNILDMDKLLNPDFPRRPKEASGPRDHCGLGSAAQLRRLACAVSVRVMQVPHPSTGRMAATNMRSEHFSTPVFPLRFDLQLVLEKVHT